MQQTLEAGVPLQRVTFCVVDLETTGGSPKDAFITEVGAVKYRGGELIGSFQSLVNPGVSIPTFVSHLTGINDRLVSCEPSIDTVLPSFLEFFRGSVFVAHNARFDFSFLNVALSRLDYGSLPGPPVCTARLARRIVLPDVPNVRLQTLAKYFRTRQTPNHRALADASATGEVLNGLLDMAGRLGILTLGDLHEAVRAKGHPNYGKIAMADDLPSVPGVYVFTGREGRVLYVGKSNDLRARVKSYFYGDERKRIDDMLAEVTGVRGIPTPAGEAEALVLEARLIKSHEPKYNRRGKTWRAGAYLKLDTSEAFPRIKVVSAAKPGDHNVYLGPFTNGSAARQAKEALEEVIPLRRCTNAMGARTRFAACALADIGRCPAPCDGRIDPQRYAELVGRLVTSLTSPGELLEALEARMDALAERERFEEAALMRDRMRALASALSRARADRWLVRAGTLELSNGDDLPLKIVAGSLETTVGEAPVDSPLSLPCPKERADELAALRTWLNQTARKGRLRPLALDGEPPAEPVDGGALLAKVNSQARDPERSERAGRR
jgi:DNA polymerase-3 subunit epsilon